VIYGVRQDKVMEAFGGESFMSGPALINVQVSQDSARKP
jgi:hypothetical protein